MKTIWARIGMSLEVSDAEYDHLRESVRLEGGSFDDLDLDDDFAHRFQKNGYVDGDSYIPGTIFENQEGQKP